MTEEKPFPAPQRDLFVFLEVFAGEGGIQSYVKDLLGAYRSLARGTDDRLLQAADVLILRDSPDCENPLDDRLAPPGKRVFNFTYLKTQPLWWGRMRLATVLLIQLLRSQPARVFCGHINLAPLVRFLCQPLGIPYIVLTYGKEVWTPLSPPYRRALNDAACVWTIGRYSRDLACRSNEIDPAKVRILPCAIDGSVFFPGAKPQHLLDLYGLGGAKVLMTVARLWSGDIYKGVDVTIRALPTIAAAFPDVKYLVVGRGDDRPRLERLARDLGVADRVVFAGFVPTAELPDHYRVADAYIMPSQEGFGIVYLEAMATGIPVLSGDSDGSADPLQDGKLGWQVPHRDPQAVAAACLEILQGDDLRCDGVWLRQQTLEKFGKDAFVRRLGELL
ncbi:MAG TPA: glycosyltransferase [Oscillatoriales cyanobacterium M4454_W2019_049]|nr:glycosyltransferase [Oscillatoriales cyanobacterium M4454_W2019_049]